MARTRKTPRKPRRRIVKVQYLARPARKPKTPDPLDPYLLIDKLVKTDHEGLVGARIAVAWMLDVKADRDGHLKLAKCKKATDLDREFREFDLVILLNASAWKELKPIQREATIYHALCCATVATDKNGDDILDERDRKCYRMRQHDIQEFNAVVKKYGMYMSDVAEFIRQAQAAPLFKDQLNAETEANGKPKEDKK